MAKQQSTSAEDLARGFVCSAPAARRVAEASCLLPAVLLRDDGRVQALYQAWTALDDLPQRVERMIVLRETWGLWAPQPEAVLQDPAVEGLRAELHGLHILTRAIGLGRYRWLPCRLWFAFAAEALGEPVVAFAFPEAPWSTRGKAPKRGGPKGYRLEDLDRTLSIFVRSEVMAVSKKRIAHAFGFTAREVRHHVRRARVLLDCLDRDLS